MQEQERQKPSLALIKDLQERSKQCHEFVRSSFRSERIEHPPLRQALEHYFSYWNDFTHPGLFSIAFEASGGKPDKALKPQAAIAMIAAGFDIHDDIIDKSLKKHDHYTVFGKYGQDLSLLLGNAFLIKGLTLLSESTVELPSEKQREIFRVVKERLFEVGNAHTLELQMRGRFDVSPDRYLAVLEMKGAGIELDMHIAALIAGGSEKEVGVLKEYGRSIGILATLREEFVDVFEGEELSRRVRDETLPLPLMFALQDPKLRERIMKILKKKKIGSLNIDELASIVLDMEPVHKLKKRMEKMCRRAIILAHQTEYRKSEILLRSLAQSMLEDL